MLTGKVRQGSLRGRLGKQVLVLLVAGGLVFSVLPVPPSQSSQGTGDTATFLSGVVTGKTESGIQIDGRTYPLHPKVTVKDEEGEEMSLEDLVPDIEVRFHLKRGKIDQIIVIQPG